MRLNFIYKNPNELLKTFSFSSRKIQTLDFSFSSRKSLSNFSFCSRKWRNSFHISFYPLESGELFSNFSSSSRKWRNWFEISLSLLIGHNYHNYGKCCELIFIKLQRIGSCHLLSFLLCWSMQSSPFTSTTKMADFVYPSCRVERVTNFVQCLEFDVQCYKS